MATMAIETISTGMRDALFAQIDGLRRHVRSLVGGLSVERVSELEESAANFEGREVTSETLRRTQASIISLEAAITRINDGSYGICVECDEQISQKRLAALPCAEHCVACAERMERK